ncbi:p22 protein precursor [Trypanosoma brucei equiperdum]|uniref:p22 protein n=1 Tax=Trypanosoma brucei equiperdum TaxID=630700 RepID=A0A3L6L4X3_9TRYP|nr:p22 protein precursor [Trypanosoma brucei equiperdum]
MRRVVASRKAICEYRLYSQVSPQGYPVTAATPQQIRRVPFYRHRKLYDLTTRELSEEAIRDFLPPKPAVPAGWSMEHKVGSCRFDLTKTMGADDSAREDLHVVALMEPKKYEQTYRMDNGERNGEEYLVFNLFIKKHQHSGGVEFGLTSIDMELVMDSLVVHSTDREMDYSIGALGPGKTTSVGTSFGQKLNIECRRCRDYRYRGPMLNELDDDLTDEILDYLDERGVNNGFAEYMMAQAHFLEQEEYLNWLRLLKQFAT